MKRIKWAALCAALVSAVGFTSCLNEDTDTTQYGQEFMRVEGSVGYYQFRSSAGYTVVPTNQSDLANWSFSSRYALVVYTYDAATVTEGTTSLNAQIISASSLKESEVNPVSATDEDGNAPVYELPNSAGDGPKCYDENTLFLPIVYYYASSNDQSEQTSELNSHRFTLYYDENDTNASDMRLQLRHTVDDPDVDRNTQGGEYRYFNIAPLLSKYRGQYGELPANITIEYVKSNTDDMSSTSEETLSFEFGKYFEN